MKTGGKIKRIEELAQISAKLRAEGKKVVLCHGVFDLMHPGHVKHLEAAAKEGDVLMVTITPDRFVNKGPGRPVFNEALRVQTIAALAAVDYAAVNEWKTAVETIRAIKPGVYAKGSDYKIAAKDVTGAITREKKAAEAGGGRLHFTDEPSFSSTGLLNKFFGVFPQETRVFLENFRERYDAERVIESLRALKKTRVLVVGEAIVDEYHYCQGLGKPPKDNIVSAKFLSEEKFPGGALACANHLAGFCSSVDLVTCLGAEDTKEDYIRSHLRPNVKPKFFYAAGSPTIVKRRYVDPVFLGKLFEVAFLKDAGLPVSVSAALQAHLSKIVRNYDLVLVSDFGHGMIDGKTVSVLEKARFLALNAQTNSANAGYNLVTKYRRADYFCIDEPEIRLAAADKYGEISRITEKIAKRLRCPRAAITRGHLGSIVYGGKPKFFGIPAFTDKIVDRVGAGDSYLSVTAPLAASGAPMDLTGFAGNAASAIKVGIVCNRSPIEPEPLFKFITALLK